MCMIADTCPLVEQNAQGNFKQFTRYVRISSLFVLFSPTVLFVQMGCTNQPFHHAHNELLQIACYSLTDFRNRQEFRKNADLSKKDFSAIEYLLRKGHRQLETYSSPGIRNINY